jgi:RNA polymerase sigma factor (sigma-70 family)
VSVTNETSIEDLFRERRGQLLRYLTLRLGNRQEAEEVMQEAFIQYMAAQETTQIETPHAFLLKIAGNIAIDRIRHNASRTAREQDWSDSHYRSQSFDAALGVGSAAQDRQLEAKEEIQRVLKVLSGLSTPVRTAFILHKFKGLTHKQVAAEMGLAQSTVEKHIIKAMRILLASAEGGSGD